MVIAYCGTLFADLALMARVVNWSFGKPLNAYLFIILELLVIHGAAIRLSMADHPFRCCFFYDFCCAHMKFSCHNESWKRFKILLVYL